MHDANAGRAAETFVPLTASAVLVNPVGLHARPSVKLTQCAKAFAAKIDQDRYASRRPGRLDRLEDSSNIRAEPSIEVAAGPGKRHGIADHLTHHVGRAFRDFGGMGNDDDSDITGI